MHGGHRFDLGGRAAREGEKVAQVHRGLDEALAEVGEHARVEGVRVDAGAALFPLCDAAEVTTRTTSEVEVRFSMSDYP